MADEGLPALLDAVRRRWRLATLVALPLALGAGVYARSLPAQYDAETTVAFAPRLGTQVGADVVRVVLPRYVAYLTADDTIAAVAAGIDADAGELSSAVDVSIATDTANLTIVVRDDDPAAAAEAVNALAAAAVADNEDDELLIAEQVAPSVAPGSPAAPPRNLLVLAGLLGGLVAGLGAAVLAERSRPRLRDAEGVAASTGLPVLGRIPVSRSLERGGTVEVSDPLVGPSVRALVAQADSAGGPGGLPAVLGITSAEAGDGKTTVAVAFAAAAARRGRRVVLLDADVDRAGLTETLAPTPGEAGGGSRSPRTARHDLGSLLESRSTLQQCLVDGPVDGLRLVPTTAGATGVDLLSRGLPALLTALAQVADLVVVDCPPVREDDGQVVLAQLPAALLVLRPATGSAEAAESGALLAGLGSRVLGVVLNRTTAPPRSPYTRAPLVGSA